MWRGGVKEVEGRGEECGEEGRCGGEKDVEGMGEGC